MMEVSIPSPAKVAGRGRLIKSLAYAALGSPALAYAHAFEERYDLPAPLSYFATGAAAVVVLSFVSVVIAPLRTTDARRLSGPGPREGAKPYPTSSTCASGTPKVRARREVVAARPSPYFPPPLPG